MKRIIVAVAALALATAAFAEAQEVSGSRDVAYGTEEGIRAIAATEPNRVVKTTGGYVIYPAGTAAPDLSKTRATPMEDGFGTSWGNTRLASMEFSPHAGSVNSHTSGGFVFRSAGSNPLSFGYAKIPHGAKIQGIWVTLNDSDGAQDITVELYRVNLNDDSYNSLVAYTTTGTPGIVRRVYVPLAAVERADSRYGIYEIWVWLRSAGGSQLFRDVTVWYYREMITAPAVQTFVDVPPSHVAYRGVEGMAASGVSVGCAIANSFCPNDFVTRAQMALFMGRALGLNVPDNVTPAP